MKTTIDLPEDLVRKIKLRALRDRRKFKDIAAELLRVGLTSQPKQRPLPKPRIGKDKLTGLPVIIAPRTPAPADQITSDKIHQILLDQEVEWILGNK